MQRTRHRAHPHHEGDDVGDHERDVVGGNSVGHPERKARQQDDQVSERDIGRGTALEHSTDLQQWGDRHQHRPGRCGNSEDFDHEERPFDVRSCGGTTSAGTTRGRGANAAGTQDTTRAPQHRGIRYRRRTGEPAAGAVDACMSANYSAVTKEIEHRDMAEAEINDESRRPASSP
jgi:hypothetical protein